MKVAAISNPNEIQTRLSESQSQGYITFIYHHADPEHELLVNKFLYVHSDEELVEKVKLLSSDFTTRELIRV